MPSYSSPKISVVILSYNFEKYLRECIESILAQTLPPFEIIICDDHSLDDSWTIISEYCRRYPELIKAYRQERNVGPAGNANFGLKRVRGDLLAWLDGDDRWLPLKLELEWKTLQENPDTQVAYSNVYIIDADGNRTGVWYDNHGPALPSGDVFVEVFSKRFFPKNPSVFRNHLRYRYTLDEIGYMDENLKSHWDWDLKIRLTARFRVSYSGEALVEYRNHSDGFHRRDPEMLFKAMVKIYEKNLPLLNQRSKLEAAKVKCYAESLLALRQETNLPLVKRLKYYSPGEVYVRNRALINQLPKQDRLALKDELGVLFKQLAHQAVSEETKKSNRRLAFDYWLKSLRYEGIRCSDVKSITQILLPLRIYERLQSVYRVLRYTQN